MKVLLIDDHGNTKELGYDDPVFDLARENHFFPCGECGHVCFEGEQTKDGCKYCAPEADTEIEV